MNISLQLWSVKEQTAQDFDQTLRQVAAMGYNGVEFAGFGGKSADEMKLLLDRAGLYSVGSHTSFDLFRNAPEEQLAYNKTLGSSYMICPGAPLNSRADVDALTDALNKAAVLAKKYGIKVGYHNHSHEFEKIDGKYIMDLIAENTSDDVVLEIDVFWVKNAGVDPYEYLTKWGKRVELVHLKQGTEDNVNVDMADGVIDMKKVMELAKYATHFIVEHEDFDKPVMDAVKNDVEFLKALS